MNEYDLEYPVYIAKLYSEKKKYPSNLYYIFQYFCDNCIVNTSNWFLDIEGLSYI